MHARGAARSQLIKALPDAEDAPPLLLPMGWEQRCDEKSRRIFFVDHITCSTTWDDPRLRKKEEEETGAEGASDFATEEQDRGAKGDDQFESGAAADLAALSLGLPLPTREEQLSQWTRAVERNAHAALLKETGHLRSAADVTQSPRFMLLQQLHGAVVSRMLAEPPVRRRRPTSEKTLAAAASSAALSDGLCPTVRVRSSRH